MTKASACSCIICKKQTSNLGLAAHYGHMHVEGNPYRDHTRLANDAVRGAPSKLKGKSLSSDHKIKLSLAGTGRQFSFETRKKISDTAKRNGLSGGFREGGGKGRKGKFKGIHCDSSWELAFLIFMFEQGKPIARVLTPRTYEFNGEKKRYYPDFIVDGQIVEIKGWKTPHWDAKQKCNQDILVLGFEEIKPMIDFAKSKYGEDFTSAYDS